MYEDGMKNDDPRGFADWLRCAVICFRDVSVEVTGTHYEFCF